MIDLQKSGGGGCYGWIFLSPFNFQLSTVNFLASHRSVPSEHREAEGHLPTFACLPAVAGLPSQCSNALTTLLCSQSLPLSALWQLRARRLPRPGRGVSALDFSFP